MQVITGNELPRTKLPFSQAVSVGDFVFISGQASVDEKGDILPGSFEQECHKSFENLGRVLQAAGLDFSDVVQVRNYVGSQEDLLAFNQVYREFFNTPFPARTTIIGCLGTMLKFEVDAIAYAPK